MEGRIKASLSGGAEAMKAIINPFLAGDPDRAQIWEMLVARDSEAFLQCDWARVAEDFAAGRFEGISANGSSDPDDWTIRYPVLDDYREDWERMAREFAAMQPMRIPPRDLIFQLTTLEQIDIARDRALCHKKFQAHELLTGGGRYTVASQTLYRLHRIEGEWKIVGFISGLPLQGAGQEAKLS